MPTRRSDNDQKSKRRSKRSSGKVGSAPEAAKAVGGEGDFGVHASEQRERDYASRQTKRNDPGAAPDRLKVGDSARESGAGANEGGPGSGSGGDIDTDILGVGAGGSGVAQSGPGDRDDGPDMTTSGGSEPFAAPGKKGHRNRKPRVTQSGSTVDRTGGDLSTTGGGQSGGAVTNPQARNDDSFMADIEEDEARGGDNSASDNK